MGLGLRRFHDERGPHIKPEPRGDSRRHSVRISGCVWRPAGLFLRFDTDTRILYTASILTRMEDYGD